MNDQERRDYALYVKAAVEITTRAVKDTTVDQIERPRDRIIFCLAASAVRGGATFLTPEEFTSAMERYSTWF